MKIVVSEILKSPIAAFHNEGLEVFSALEQAFKSHQLMEISFEGINRCSTQFLNASIGKMYLLFDPKQIDNLLKINFASLPHLAEKIEEVKENAINSKEYDSLIENAIA
ncbi:STAS-like domain-containing protein [Chitinophaga sp. Ak27]|uniref:STAS-like domain-containing protein n=1 Tax=Chitinophaga sp. Ak27 TaxID=2726116 RepID=UPI00145DC296|nr:DUF4325 domain-containing protein [Chitinophaga sp. Ak27]NLU96305.1 STAS-like domain-containing protein [Chitinophaga sp. Ak27]